MEPSFEDPQVQKIQNMLKAIGRRTNNNLLNKIKFYPTISDELRAYDQFSQSTKLDQIRGLKEEHFKIGEIFQNLNIDFFYQLNQ